MTRKDYERLALALKAAQPGFVTFAEGAVMTERRRGFLKAIEAVADACKAENPLFNRARFLAAAGVQS